jgi:hypothetical protein
MGSTTGCGRRARCSAVPSSLALISSIQPMSTAPGDNERLIREALHPYTANLVIGTKAGLVHTSPATRENPGMSMNGCVWSKQASLQ